MKLHKHLPAALLLLSLLLSPAPLHAQTTELSQLLQDMGLEDIAIIEHEGICRIAYTDPVYRGASRGIREVVRTLLGRAATIKGGLHLIVEEDRIPQITVVLDSTTILSYRRRELGLRGVMANLHISYDTDADATLLKHAPRSNTSAGKIDLVLYPRVSLNNAWYDKLYGAAFDIAPALEIGLWKGATFTGQAIFPLWNNLTGEVDYIRAGMITLRQDYRFPRNLFASLSVGHFNSNRIGADLSLAYRPITDRWMLRLNAGLTGLSTFYTGHWHVTQWGRLTGSLAFRYNLPHYHLQFDIAAQRYIYGDHGIRLDCSRHFGEVTVGFFAMYTDGEPNGGFHLAIPLPQKKRPARKAIRIRLPEHFDWEYQAQSGNDYAKRRLGRYYETRPDENRSRNYYQPEYLQDCLINNFP